MYKLRCKFAEPGTTILPPASNNNTVSNNDNVADEDASDSSLDEDEENEPVELEDGPEFISDQCLFCSDRLGSLDVNVSHMRDAHSFIIPYQELLIVDVETFIWYLHLVIFGYHECILCGSRRGALEAVQQHMLAKGHCRFSISDELAEFYDSSKLESLSSRADLVRVDEASLRLPSGKLLTHRSHANQASKSHLALLSASDQLPQQRQQKMLSAEAASGDETMASLPHMPSDALVRRDRRTDTLAVQISRLSASDQRGLMHLSAPEQRAVLATQKKQLERARREEKHMWGKVQRLANKTMMMHFKPDTPGRSNG